MMKGFFIYLLINKSNQVGLCYPIKMLRLLCILYFLFHSITSITFYNPHFRYKTANLEFCNDLHTRLHVSLFICDRRLIAKAKVAVAKTITPQIAVVTSSENTYGLHDLLQYISDNRGNHVVILTFESRDVLHLAHWTLNYFNKNWIWIHVAVLKGPNGDTPTFPAVDLEAELQLMGLVRNLWMCYDMTTKPVEPYGYTRKHMEALDKYAFSGILERTRGVMMFDILHASHSSISPGSMKSMRYVIFKETNQTNVADINMKGLWKIIDGLGIEKVYLDVNRKLRRKIMDRYPDQEDGDQEFNENGAARQKNEGLLLWTTLILIYLLD